MGSKHFAKDPLLYIQQPIISTPVAPMQHNYYTPNHKQKVSDQIDKRKKRTIPLKRSHSTISQDIVEEVFEEKPSEKIPEQSKFKDLTIIEKVHYFIDRSEHAPIIKCEVQTKEKKYHGVITDFENDQVLIRVGKRSSSSEVPLNEITNIRILGF